MPVNNPGSPLVWTLPTGSPTSAQWLPPSAPAGASVLLFVGTLATSSGNVAAVCLNGKDGVDVDTHTAYPMPAGTAMLLRGNSYENNTVTPTRVTVYKNGAPTALAISVPANTTGHFSDLVNSISFADDDEMMLVIDNTSGGAERSATIFISLVYG